MSVTDFSIHSRDRQSVGLISLQDSAHTASNFIVLLPQTLHNVRGFYLDHVSIPLSLDVISSRRRNNTLVVNFGGSDSTITLKSGSPSVSDLISDLQTKLQAVDAGFAVSFDSYSNRATISHDSTAFGLKFESSSDRVHLLLGFERTNVSGSTSYTGGNVPCVTLQEIRVFSRTLSVFSRGKHSSNEANFIASIPVTVDPYSYLKFEPLRPVCHQGSSASLNSIDIYFTDEAGNVLDLEGQDTMLGLRFIQ